MAILSEGEIHLEQKRELPRNVGMGNPNAQLVDVQKRPPIKILAADKDLATIHDQVLGVMTAAGKEVEIHKTHGGPRQLLQKGDCLGVELAHLFVENHPHTNTARGGLAKGLQNRIKGLIPRGRDVKTGPIDALFCALNHVQPDFLRGGKLWETEFHSLRHRLHQDRFTRRKCHEFLGLLDDDFLQSAPRK